MFKKSYMAAMDYSHYLYLRKGTVPNTEEGKLWYQEDTKGMTVSGGTVRIAKDDSNLIGISIGGGAPLCPCLYIVQVFDNTPAARDETLDSGDEILAVNGECVKGKTKVDVAKLIQGAKGHLSGRLDLSKRVFKIQKVIWNNLRRCFLMTKNYLKHSE
uniref:PRKCA-binding protein n=1 Tax=Lepeophtheirus salmonis TaxID=72036 RepID=D3PIX5_LEPSM|nr:PRKCA-binding protein [Lepeophtheirus salmonis]